MPIINLKIVYPDYHSDDFMLEVSEQIAEVFATSFRSEAAYQFRRRYHGATLFFDDSSEDYISKRSNKYPTLEEIFDMQTEKELLYIALSQLPQVQARRVYAHYILGMSKAEIARHEEVNESSIRESIRGGIKNLKNILKSF